MSDQSNLPTPTDDGSEAQRALATLKDAAGLVQTYAKGMVGNQRAGEFATHISIMAARDDRFKNAKPESVVAAMMACVHLDLMPNTPQQYAYLIPYNSKNGVEIQFQLGYKGLLELAHRTGMVKAIYAELVFEGDEFDVEFGTERRITHKPNLSVDRTDGKLVTNAYMVAVLENGERVFEVMTREQLDKIKDSAKASSTDAPWSKWETEMMRKSVVKRGTKLLPSSGKDNRLQFAATIDSWGEAGKLRFVNGEIIEGEVGQDIEELKAARRAKIEAAELKRKELTAGNHVAAAVQNGGGDAEE